MGGKSKSTSTQTSTLNPWSQQQYADLSGQVKGLLGGEYKPYTGQMTAGPNAMQQQAGQSVQGLLGYQPQQVQAKQFNAADLQKFMDPELDNVVNRTLGGIERNRQIQQVADNQSATAAGAWGGSRHGVQDSLTNEAALRASGDAEASLRSAAYQNALGQWSADAGRQLQADQFNANSGLQGAQFQLGAAGLLGNLGAQQQQFEQAGLDRQYADFLRGYEDPFKRASGYMGLLGATPMLTNTTGTTVNKANPVDQWLTAMGNAAQIAGTVAMSDRRLKENVEYVETDANGVRWYDFTYADDPSGAVHRGVMAQDLLEQDPNHPAVSVGEDGFYRVNYGAL